MELRLCRTLEIVQFGCLRRSTACCNDNVIFVLSELAYKLVANATVSTEAKLSLEVRYKERLGAHPVINQDGMMEGR
jgi:hypothetical protein